MTASVLADVHGDLLVVRPPVPATCNKAGANYKSEVTHLDYSPRRAYDEWLSILDGIVACGGDAIYAFEAVDEPFLDHDALEVDAAGDIRAAGATAVLGNLRDVETGRVFTANGPWVTVDGGRARAVMPHMLPHRRGEASYYRALLADLAAQAGVALELIDNPHRWEGMADVAVVGDRVILTHAVPGHYDQGLAPKSPRSCLDGVTFAADQHGVPAEARIYAELVYPHFHGDTVHFGARPPSGAPVLVHYAGGLWGDGHDRVVAALGGDHVVAIGIDDAVHQYAGNSRQVRDGVLVPDGVSPRFVAAIEALGLTTHRVPLFELFGKAGGGPACATLYLPRGLAVPADSPLRYSATRDAVRARRERIPQRLTVASDYFAGKPRG
ncbi:MAG: hypothetical protein H6709_23640 [Kofleriaceae bacterium]|nr:hypothetical protein [Myxococcales bacterium]MCB9565007.1 hypothetical protein [Kofleriaceae bacterium]MCB9575080.1 hypothetical protein [Kofleriaceae bacterium]